MDPTYWFNISRAFTFVGGIITLLGILGLWHFGNINAKNTAVRISDSETETAVAQAEAAKANNKTRKLELDIVEANKETQKAKLQTEGLKLEVEKAKKERGNLKLQNKLLKIEADRIKSFKIVSWITFQTNKQEIETKRKRKSGIRSGVVLSIDKEPPIYSFSNDLTWLEKQIAIDRKQIMFNYEPEYDLILSNSISQIKSINYLSFNFGHFFSKAKYQLLTNKVLVEFAFIINGNEVLRFNEIIEDITTYSDIEITDKLKTLKIIQNKIK